MWLSPGLWYWPSLLGVNECSSSFVAPRCQPDSVAPTHWSGLGHHHIFVRSSCHRRQLRFIEVAIVFVWSHNWFICVLNQFYTWVTTRLKVSFYHPPQKRCQSWGSVTQQGVSESFLMCVGTFYWPYSLQSRSQGTGQDKANQFS